MIKTSAKIIDNIDFGLTHSQGSKPRVESGISLGTHHIDETRNP